MNKEKKFDAVKIMREIRNKLHHEYEKNPEKREKDLERIRNKYMKLKTARLINRTSTGTRRQPPILA